jgi:glyoxylase-like metal-dependent hydrolase (beta-lactamase superfamily II)
MSELVPIEDAAGSFVTYRQGFGKDDDSPWQMPFRVFLAQLEGANVLVDLGVGPPGAGTFLPERQGRLPDELARRGLAARDIDLVVFTHLHVDHVGWAVVGGEPYFANARYVAHADDFAYYAQPDTDRLDIRDRLAELLRDGRVEALTGDAEVHPGVLVRHMPGHTPGHCIVELAGTVVLGDTAVNTLQVSDPDLPFVAEVDKAQAAATRRRLLSELAARHALVASPHFPEPFGRVAAADGGFFWEAAD